MKRFIYNITITLFLVFVSSSAVSAAVKVITTTTDLASIVRAVGGDLVEVESLCRGSQDPHRLRATPTMVVRLSKADLFVQNGLNLEVGWVPSLVRSSRSDEIRPGGRGYVDASSRVKLLEVPTGRVDRSMGDVHPFGNPHYTLDPSRAKVAAWNIVSGLNRVDPANAKIYNKRLSAFYTRVDSAVATAKKTLESYKGDGVLVYHKRYEYLLDRLGLKVIATIEPKPGIPPSAAHIARLILRHKKEGIRAVLIQPWDDARLAGQVATGIGARIVVPCPAIGGCGDGEDDDIVSLFKKNVGILEAALAAK